MLVAILKILVFIVPAHTLVKARPHLREWLYPEPMGNSETSCLLTTAGCPVAIHRHWSDREPAGPPGISWYAAFSKRYVFELPVAARERMSLE